MGVLATVVLCWAAVYGYVSLYYCLLYFRRPSDQEYLGFGLIALGLCVFSAARAVLMQASGLDEAWLADRFAWAGLILTIPAFVHFAHALVNVRSVVVPLSVAFGVVGILASGLGLPVHREVPAPAGTLGLRTAPDYAEPHVTAVGMVLLAGMLLFGILALARLAPSASRDREARYMLVGTGASVVAGVHDILVRIGLLRSFYLLEHTSMLVVLMMSYLLLDRFVRTSIELRSRTEELDGSYRQLRRTQQRLVRKEQLAAVGELSAVIAHEVRNPLAIIKNAVSGLRRPHLRPEDRTTLLGILGEETSRLARLVEDLIAYARPMMPEDRSVDLDELVWGAVDLARSANPQSGKVAVTVSLEEAPETVHGDPALLRQALMNIIDNALQAMPQGGELTIRARESEEEGRPVLAVDIEDTGEGMDTLVREKARNPFFTTRPAGTGLGLAIVERVIRNHGGRLDIDSSHGVGTTVRLAIPDGRRVDDGQKGGA